MRAEVGIVLKLMIHRAEFVLYKSYRERNVRYARASHLTLPQFLTCAKEAKRWDSLGLWMLSRL